MSRPALPLADDACWLALRSRDARFDGSFFTGVTSTGIYCRPVCRVRTPRRENCRFFRHAAQAEQAGFRPCLRCRPELAPQAMHWSSHDAASILVREAARRLDAPDALTEEGPVLPALAAALGVSDRHLRRVFEAEVGVSPIQYLQTRRLLTAKQLLADTRLPVTQVAELSGFGSLRRFNASFQSHYGLSPSRLRREGAAPARSPLAVRLAYRPPYDTPAMLAFLSRRQIAGIEQVDEETGLWSRSLALRSGGQLHTGWMQVRFDPTQSHVLVQASESLHPVLPALIRRLRAALDLDADPQAIEAVLGGDFPGGAGLRVPGSLCGFELAVRAVLGQQVTVAAARTFCRRLVERFGEPLATPLPGVDRLFPSPQALAGVPGEALGALGIVRQRQAALAALARAVAEGRLVLEPAADPAATIASLRELPGFGDWTAQYIAMRALRWPDAFPAGDVAVQQALGLRSGPQPLRAATVRAEAWRPWRGYAVIRAWAGLYQPVAQPPQEPLRESTP